MRVPVDNPTKSTVGDEEVRETQKVACKVQSHEKTLHQQLCQVAVRWLKRAPSAGGPGCAVAVSECKTGFSGEIPDAIGFRRTGYEPLDGSTLIEVKTSRSDFLADAHKPHRQAGGVGAWRYYMCPTGLIAVEELPIGWGLLEVNGRGHVKALAGHALYFRQAKGYREYVRQASLWRFTDVDLVREQFLLVRTIANAGDPQKVLDLIRDTNNRAARLLSAIGRVAAALGLPKYASSDEVERAVKMLMRQKDRWLQGQGNPAPIARRLARHAAPGLNGDDFL